MQSLVDEQEEPQRYDSMAPLTASSPERVPPQRQVSVLSESEPPGPKQRSAMASIFAYVMKQSYATALIVMMVMCVFIYL